MKYVSDEHTYWPSGLANSPEFPVKINGELCKNSAGEMGGCYIRIRDDHQTMFEIMPLPYSYRLSFKCTKNLDFPPIDERDYSAKEAVYIAIERDQYNGQTSFMCTGRIFPDDRNEPINSFFEVRVRLVRPEYIGREQMHHTGKYQVFGKNALHSMWYVDDEWKYGHKKTYLETKKHILAFSESHNMRWNYYAGN
jgi:hypothetical protein